MPAAFAEVPVCSGGYRFDIAAAVQDPGFTDGSGNAATVKGGPRVESRSLKPGSVERGFVARLTLGASAGAHSPVG